MRSMLLSLLVAILVTGCLSPEPTSDPQGGDPATPEVVVTDQPVASAGLPSCETVLPQPTDGVMVLVPQDSGGSVAVVYEDQQAICTDPLATLFALGVVTSSDVARVGVALAGHTGQVSSSDPIPAHGDSVSSSDPIPAHNMKQMESALRGTSR